MTNSMYMKIHRLKVIIGNGQTMDLSENEKKNMNERHSRTATFSANGVHKRLIELTTNHYYRKTQILPKRY